MSIGTVLETYSSDNPLVQGYEWLMNPAHWQGQDGIPLRTVGHLGYTCLTLAIAVAIAAPIGLYVGHTGRGRVVVIALAGVLRALPTLGVLTLFVLLAGLGLMPPIWALVLLAVPPILAGTYAGISAVSTDTVDAARSMGMTEVQILFRVEVPNGLPVILGGFRAGVLQVVATVAVVAYINLGGLGRFLIDGLSVSDYGRVLGGAVVIAVLAICLDTVLAGVQRLAVSPGLKAVPQRTSDSLTGREIITAGVQGGNS
ncbi:ABC transporter permease [Arthrobacter sp. A5]|uniref:ABC transporter permease n=1 Tax=Arthrobacter sp. A5 TaxID=576926 RepID=UPI003DA870C0